MLVKFNKGFVKRSKDGIRQASYTCGAVEEVPDSAALELMEAGVVDEVPAPKKPKKENPK